MVSAPKPIPTSPTHAIFLRACLGFAFLLVYSAESVLLSCQPPFYPYDLPKFLCIYLFILYSLYLQFFPDIYILNVD
jgi:hypothetical protein